VDKAAENVTQAIRRGNLTPAEGSIMMNILESRSRVIERVQLESRLENLEAALAAAEHPAEGDWLYFVTIDMQGTTLFTRDYPQHLANIELAKRNGVLDSAR
jgi:hypothetical protein